MKFPFRLILPGIAVALFAFFFASCTTSLEPEVIAADGNVYSQEEFESKIKNGELDSTGHAIDTTSSVENDSLSSSSEAGEASSSSVADSSTVSSSSEKTESSSSEEVESSSSSPLSSSSVEESSSSYEAVFGEHESIVAKDGVLSIGIDAMSDVNDDDAEDLESVKAVVEGSSDKLPDGYRDFGLETTMEDFNYESFMENQYFCLTKESSWLQVSRSKLGEHIAHFKNGASLGPLESFKVSFADACSAVYAKPAD